MIQSPTQIQITPMQPFGRSEDGGALSDGALSAFSSGWLAQTVDRPEVWVDMPKKDPLDVNMGSLKSMILTLLHVWRGSSMFVM